MAQHSSRAHNHYNGDTTTNTAQTQNNVLHDFMGMKKTTDSPLLLPSKTASFVSDASLSTSASLGTSDLASSERQVRGHLEGVPFYGHRNDISGPESSSKLAGYKRSNLDSTFTVAYRDGIPQLGPDSLESSHLMKILRNGAGGERTRRFSDANLSKWETPGPLSVNPATQYPLRGGQVSLLTHKVTQNKFQDTHASPSVISPSAADEGSRTGVKGSGILSLVTEQNTSKVQSGSSNLKSMAHISAPETSTRPSGHGQMTIFYGGQAHVFDDVHPNKADVIMALARSNGGSWSTTFSPKSAMRTGSESCRPGRENEAGITINTAFSKEIRGKLSTIGNSSHGVRSSDWISSKHGGGNQGSFMDRETRNQVPASERE